MAVEDWLKKTVFLMSIKNRLLVLISKLYSHSQALDQVVFFLLTDSYLGG